MTHTPLILRPGDPADHPIVADSWARSFGRRAEHGGPLGDRWCDHGRSLLAPDLFHASHRGVIDLLLARSGLVVGYTHDHAPEVVAAWCAFEWSAGSITLHYAWTRSELRGRGYGQEVLRCALGLAGGPDRVRASHMTMAGRALLDGLRRRDARSLLERQCTSRGEHDWSRDEMMNLYRCGKCNAETTDSAIQERAGAPT